MNDAQFDRIMEQWAEDEVHALPALYPTLAVYRHLAVQGHGRFAGVSWRWASAGAVVALVAGLVASYQYVFRAPPLLRSSAPIVGVRPAFETEKDRPEAPAPGRGPERAPKGKASRATNEFLQLALQYQRRGSPTIESIDLRLPDPPALALGVEDNYRLVITPRLDRHVYAFQVDPDDRLVRLFPETRFNAAVNPLRAGGPTTVPAPTAWFHLEAATGVDRLYVLSSPRPRSDWDRLYQDCARETNPAKQREQVRVLMRSLDAAAGDPAAETVGLVYAVRHR